MRIAVCDDERTAREELINELNIYAERFGLELLIYQYADGSELLASSIDHDVIFMDHQMKNINGLDAAAELRKRKDDTVVIFVSSYRDVVFDSMKVSAFRFLVKPFEREDLYEALDSVIKNKNDDVQIILKDLQLKENVIISEKDIIYAQADSHHVLVVTEQGTFKYTNNISELEKSLHADHFFRTNRSYIVSFKFVARYGKKEIELKNGHKALLSVSKAKEFKTKYLNYIRSKTIGG